MRLDPLVYKVKKKIDYYNLNQKDFYLLCSGGEDSVLLFHILKQMNLSFKLIHFHHGDFDNKRFRDEAKDFVENLCSVNAIEFILKKANSQLKSEQDFRSFRLDYLRQLKSKNRVFIYGHHFEDLLETRMHRLIRGTGIKGLLAMKIWKNPVFRPLLDTKYMDRKSFIKKYKISFLKDPSNNDTKFFRNFLRQRWLKELEDYAPGSLGALSQSLETICSQWSSLEKDLEPWLNKEGIDRNFTMFLNKAQSLQVLALYCKKAGLFGFKRSQLEELYKLLDRRDKNYSFSYLGRDWVLTEHKLYLLDQD